MECNDASLTSQYLSKRGVVSSSYFTPVKNVNSISYLSSENVLGLYLIFMCFLYVFSDPCAFVTDIVLILIFFHLIFQTTVKK